MNDSEFQLNAAIQQRIDDYLDEVESVLRDSGMLRGERQGVLDDVQTQILDMLMLRGDGVPTEQDVLAVLAELDPPESYADADGAEDAAKLSPAPQVITPQAQPRFSIMAIVGALWAITSVFILFYAGGPIYSNGFILWILLVLSVTSPFGSFILGLISISQIRHSEGRIYGLGLAVADVLFLPLIAWAAVSAGLIWFSLRVIMFLMGKQIMLGVSLRWITLFSLEILVFLFGAFFIIRWVWKAANKPITGLNA